MKELQKLREPVVYSYASRAEALNDRGGKFVKTRWVLTENGCDIRLVVFTHAYHGGSAGGVRRHTAVVCGEVADEPKSELSRQAFDTHGLGHLLCLAVRLSGKCVVY